MLTANNTSVRALLDHLRCRRGRRREFLCLCRQVENSASAEPPV